MANLIVSLIIISILSLSVLTIVREKRKGVKCVGCPYSKASGKGPACGCH
ncbi:FeoB-associated Cys-rich membrane protein [Spirochaeta isovalerica]|uniref:FeoB-associated Cys-rich membrane protein n=1 Tax=Spirochaeta isovalerica TaxID=150 RepID=A0A841RGK8_9SPIO|nr:FeoB-associated Cys-rich membrane protein [Spirochaeta isovalerica]MBB6482521.1 hypothetical protein [Spirochaeta isovalerica]